jgi:hypothetical protein
MIKKALTMCAVFVLVGVLVGVSGCASPSSNPSPTTSALDQMGSRPTTQARTSPSISPSTAVIPTLSPATSFFKMATTIRVWEGYMGQPAFWLDYPQYHVALKQGGSEQVRYWIDAADGKHPCGAANYYIDNYAAGGKWDITKPNPQYWEGCPSGLPGGAGGLYLYPQDTMKLSPGWHTLKIDFLGDDTYAPSEFTAQFLVVGAGQPTPTPTF